MPKSDEEKTREMVAALPEGVRTMLLMSLLMQIRDPMRALADMGPCRCGDSSCIGSGITDAATKFNATMRDLLTRPDAPPAEAVSLDTVVSKLGEIRDEPKRTT